MILNLRQAELGISENVSCLVTDGAANMVAGVETHD